MGVCLVRLIDDLGCPLDAEYLVEADGGALAVIVESRSGMSGRRPPRNTDYNRALTMLLARLGALDGVLADALVDSRRTQALRVLEADRRLIQAPVRLALEPDTDALRRRLGTAQAKIAQAPGATKGGNSTKRIRLRVEVPGFRPGDAGLLAQALSAPIVHTAEQGPAPASPAEQAEEAVKYAAGKLARPGRGQGFHLDQDMKVAMEAHAMNMATELYSADWKVEDVHGTESYDLVCRRGDEIKHVEVKGTTTDGAEVILTPNEVRHAREYPCTALFVLSNITVERADDGTITATGGRNASTVRGAWTRER